MGITPSGPLAPFGELCTLKRDSVNATEIAKMGSTSTFDASVATRLQISIRVAIDFDAFSMYDFDGASPINVVKAIQQGIKNSMCPQNVRVDMNLKDVTIVDWTDQDRKHMVLEMVSVMEIASPQDIEFAHSVDADFMTTMLSTYMELKKQRLSSLVNAVKCLLNDLSGIMVFIGDAKNHFKIPRPHVWAEEFGISLPRSAQSVYIDSYSYPSGHALVSRMIAHCLSQGDDENVRAELFRLANRIAFSRVHLGVHTLRDIYEGIRLADMHYGM